MHRLSWLLVPLLACSCAGLRMRPEVKDRVDRVESERLRAHILALDEIGPRPTSDPEATRATVDYLTGVLTRSGWEIREELFEHRFPTRIFAVVRPVDDPGAGPIEIEVAPDLMKAGSFATRAKAEALRREGWEFEEFKGRGALLPQTFRVPNLIATRPGTDRSNEVIELCAHYDTAPYCPGAIDNSSGVAALLEVARVLADAPMRRTVRLCFFGGEEIRLRGSEAHVKRIEEDPDTEVVGLINLDSVGSTATGPGSQREPEGVPWYLSFPDEGNFVVVIGAWSSGWLGNLYEGAIATYAPDLPYYSANRIGSLFPDAYRSDHANYWKADIPAIFVTDTGEFRGSTYHTPEDTEDMIDYDFLESVTRATAAATLHWAGLEE